MTLKEKNKIISDFAFSCGIPGVRKATTPRPYTEFFDWLWEATALCRAKTLQEELAPLLMEPWLKVARALYSVDKSALFEAVCEFAIAYEKIENKIRYGQGDN